MPIPPLSANFAQIPVEFLRFLISSNLSRNELLVLLQMAARTFSFEKTPAFFSPDEIARGTGLDRDAVLATLSKSAERGIVIKLLVENDPENQHYYLLHTADAAFLPAFESNAEDASIGSPLHMNHSFDDSDQTITPPLGSPEGAVKTQRSPIVARLESLLGRSLVKDEADRLDLLGASPEELEAAIESVQARRINLYSPDQIIYEYESLQRQRKATPIPQAKPTGKARERTQRCKECNGTGYVFGVNKNSIRLCDCRR